MYNTSEMSLVEIHEEMKRMERKAENFEFICDSIRKRVVAIMNEQEEAFKAKVREKGTYIDSNEAVKMVASLDVLEKVLTEIDTYIEGYYVCYEDEYMDLARSAEPDVIEESNIQDDIDYTCYPLDTNEENDDEVVPF